MTLGRISVNPARMNGQPCIRNLRLTVRREMESENLREGASVDEFLEWFPGVERSQVEEVLNRREP